MENFDCHIDFVGVQDGPVGVSSTSTQNRLMDTAVEQVGRSWKLHECLSRGAVRKEISTIQSPRDRCWRELCKKLGIASMLFIPSSLIGFGPRPTMVGSMISHRIGDHDSVYPFPLHIRSE